MARIEDAGSSSRYNRINSERSNQSTTTARTTAETVKYNRGSIDYLNGSAAFNRYRAGSPTQTPTPTPTTPTAAPTTAPTKNPQNISYERFDKTLDYMFNEMKTNINSQSVKNIKGQLEYADFLMHPKSFWDRVTGALAQAGGASAADSINSALMTWGMKVRPGGDWDHKPKLDQMLGLGKDNDYYFPVRGDNKHEVYYDIWSNIHYGYVGSAAGLDGKTLQEGAQAFDGIAGRNDKVDEVTVQIGIDLWNKYGSNMTKEQFHQEVVSRLPEIMKAQESQGSKQIIDITNGR